jgi:opacity protein-like surface antigen
MRKTAFLIATCTLCTSHVQFASARPAQGFYASLQRGTNFLEDTDLEISIPNNPPLEGGLVFDTGWALGVAFGYQWSNGISLEGETTYRENGLKRQEMMGMTVDIDGDINSFAGMLNAKYELETGGPLTPFIGAGIGAALITVDANPDTPDAFKQFAYQAMAGINYELSSQLTLGLEFIYFGAGSPTFHQDGISPTIDYQSEDVFLTISYRLQ